MERDTSRPYFANTEDLKGLTNPNNYQIPATQAVPGVYSAQQVVRDRDAKQPSSILRELEAFDKTAIELVEVTALLNDKLMPVMGPPPPTAEKSPEDGAPYKSTMCAVSDQIRNLRERVNH